MKKVKYPDDLKIEIAKAYINGEGSYDSLARKYGVGHKSVETWARIFREHGEGGFVTRSGNRSYSYEFKIQCGARGTVLPAPYSDKNCSFQ